MNTNLHPTMQAALAPFLPGGSVAAAMRVVDANRPHVLKTFIQQPNKLQDTAHLAGLFEYQWTSWSGLKVDCYCEYEAAHDGGTGPNSEESWPESMSLTYALVNGVDVDSLISNDNRNEICAEALGAYLADWSTP